MLLLVSYSWSLGDQLNLDVVYSNFVFLELQYVAST